MKIKFNDKIYKKDNRSGVSLRDLCFDIFKFYLEKNPNNSYEELKKVFNNEEIHKQLSSAKSRRKVLFNENEFQNWYLNYSENDSKKDERYFEPIKYNNEKLYFTTQWGNAKNDGIGNINRMIEFAKKQGYDIEVLEDEKNNKEIEDKTLTKQKNNTIITKNIILYGPPGVGKTHNINKLIKLIEDSKLINEIFKTIQKNQEDRIVLDEELQSRIKFVTFHQSFAYEDFIEGFRPNEEGKIDLVNGIFKDIAKKAEENKFISIKGIETFENAYFILKEKFINNNFPMLETSTGIEIIVNSFSDRNIKVKSKGAKNEFSIKYSDLEIVVNGLISNKVKRAVDIKKLNVKKDTIALASYYLAIGKEIVSIMNIQKVTKRKQQNYYLIIDEINRGNISKIFGELITLIEEDKRDSLTVTLPYSKELFSVPNNLYIIGTMNSSDKSIALIDIALRRRFTFLKLEPNRELVRDDAKEIFDELNKYIEDKLGSDYKIGHSYFMSDIDLDFIKEYKIKPLLEEYFYGDSEGLDGALGILYLKGSENL